MVHGGDGGGKAGESGHSAVELPRRVGWGTGREWLADSSTAHFFRHLFLFWFDPLPQVVTLSRALPDRTKGRVFAPSGRPWPGFELPDEQFIQRYQKLIPDIGGSPRNASCVLAFNGVCLGSMWGSMSDISDSHPLQPF